MKISSSAVFALLVALASPVKAQQSVSPPSSIRVTGDATVIAKPERAQIDVGVVTQEKQSQATVSQNARQLEAVQAAVRKLLGNDADIKTVSYSLNPDYQYRPIGGKPSVSSYTAINVIRVTLDELDRVGAVIDAATQAGANHVESVQFTVRDEQALHAQALREAAARARANAEALAAALNLKVVRVLSVEEGRDIEAQPNELMAARAPEGPEATPIQPASFSVTASVALTVEVGSR